MKCNRNGYKFDSKEQSRNKMNIILAPMKLEVYLVNKTQSFPFNTTLPALLYKDTENQKARFYEKYFTIFTPTEFTGKNSWLHYLGKNLILYIFWLSYFNF